MVIGVQLQLQSAIQAHFQVFRVALQKHPQCVAPNPSTL